MPYDDIFSLGGERANGMPILAVWKEEMVVIRLFTWNCPYSTAIRFFAGKCIR
jgi:hypothetical protein